MAANVRHVGEMDILADPFMPCSIPKGLPIPPNLTAVLAGPSTTEKQRRVTNQTVLQLQAEVLQYQKEVLILKKRKLEIEIRNLMPGSS